MKSPLLESTTAWALRLLRIPPEPHLPAGDPASARVFRAGENYWRLKLLGWGFKQVAAVIGYGAFFLFLHTAPWAVALVEKKFDPTVSTITRFWISLAQLIEPIAIVLFLVQLPISYRLARLDYELRWYIVTDRAARLREGILSLNEMTFTLSNVQDISIRQNPIQRLLGLADVEMRTAGGSSGAGEGAHGGGMEKNLHLAKFRMVENATEIRDLVRERMKHARDAGLGDPDDAREVAVAAGRSSGATVASSGSAILSNAVSRLREESAALRRASAALS
jgi:uncharacterized membrane protein YdbT with pleckstrin-like domain